MLDYIYRRSLILRNKNKITKKTKTKKIPEKKEEEKETHSDDFISLTGTIPMMNRINGPDPFFPNRSILKFLSV